MLSVGFAADSVLMLFGTTKIQIIFELSTFVDKNFAQICNFFCSACEILAYVGWIPY